MLGGFNEGGTELEQGEALPRKEMSALKAVLQKFVELEGR
jgi:hypothetical protein